MTQTVASAKFQYQLPKHEEGAKRRGEGGWQRCPASYPKCLHTWQLKCKCYLLISRLENPRTCHERQDLGNTPNGVRLLTQQLCYQFRIALIKSDHVTHCPLRSTMLLPRLPSPPSCTCKIPADFQSMFTSTTSMVATKSLWVLLGVIISI